MDSRSFAHGNGPVDGGPGGMDIEVSQPNHWWALVNGVVPR